MSSSPSSKRSIKPNPATAAGKQPIAPAPDVTATGQVSAAAAAGDSSLGDLSAPGFGSPSTSRKRRVSGGQAVSNAPLAPATMPSIPVPTVSSFADSAGGSSTTDPGAHMPPPVKKGRTNTPWTPAEEQRLKQMRDAGHSWNEIAKTFPARTEGSVKKHWYKDMHYAEFAEDESAALLAAIKEYEASKWKVIGQKVGKPAKACEQYAKEHFGGKY